jgi:hypothetical protein
MWQKSEDEMMWYAFSMQRESLRKKKEMITELAKSPTT